MKKRKCHLIEWFTQSQGTIGIGVFDSDEMELATPHCTSQKPKKVIRIAPVAGNNEKADIKYIEDWGARIPAATLFKILRAQGAL